MPAYRIEHGKDRNLLAHDFASYVDCQRRVDEEFKKPKEWAKKCPFAIAGMGFFSTDRTTQVGASEFCPRGELYVCSGFAPGC